MKIVTVKTARHVKQAMSGYGVGRLYFWNPDEPVRITEICELASGAFRLMLDNGYSVRILDAILVEEKQEEQ